MYKNTTKISLFVLLFIYIINIWVRWIHLTPNPINYDVFGYYLYLPFTIIYNDIGLQHKEILDQLISQYNLTSGFYQAIKGPVGYWVMKYSMGMAVYYSPGFFVAHVIALLTNYPADGFSDPYKWALIINSSLFVFLGLYVLRKVLLRFFSDKITAIVLVLIFFGTNYYAYGTYSAQSVHSYLFTMYALIIWLTIKWHDNFRIKYVIFLSLAISSMALARPTDLLALIIPLFWNVYNKKSLQTKILTLKQNKGGAQLLVFVLIMAFAGFLQMIYWKLYSGSFVYFSYINPGEGFEFLDPYTLKVLFSFRNGWLIYTPLMLVAILGFYYLYKANIKIFTPIFLFFIINIYIVSSWSCWWYAGGLGHRAFVQSYPLMSIPLGYFIHQSYRKPIAIKVIITIILVLFLILNQFQAWQLRNSILSIDRMTYEYYVSSFGKTKVDYYKKAELCLIERSKSDSLVNERLYKKVTLKTFDFDSITKNPNNYSDSILYSGKFSYKIDSKIKFITLLELPYKDLTTKDHAWIRLKMYVWIDEKFIDNSVLLSLSFSNNEKKYNYKIIDLDKLRKSNKILPGQWNEVKVDYLTPEVRSKNDILRVQIWNRGNTVFYIDELTIELFESKKKQFF